MRKVPTLYERDPDDRSRLLDVVNPTCLWVLAGEGAATRKYDGTCVMRLDDETRVRLDPETVGQAVPLWWARREVKRGKATPEVFIPVETDETTGKTVGWEPMAASAWHKWWAEATGGDPDGFPPGTYELVGPKVNGNPENSPSHLLFAHDEASVLVDAPREYDVLRDYLTAHDIEGIVWHHPDGRMAKIKGRDFGLRREAMSDS